MQLAHKQSNFSNVRYAALAPELAITLGLGKKSFIETSAYYSALPLRNSASAAIAYWSVTGRASFPLLPPLHMGPGFFYRSMTVSTEEFGYQNVSGPDIGTHLDINWLKNKKIQFGGRLGLVSKGSKSFSLSNKEETLWARCAFPLKRNFLWFQFEYVRTMLTLPDVFQRNVVVDSSVARFSVLFGK